MEINHTMRLWALDDRFLHGRMSFICGPRQIGKTTLVQNFLNKLGQIDNYYNWDTLTLKQKFAENPLFFIENIQTPILPGKILPVEERQWVVFDEIHKYPQWKNILKGHYDELKNSLKFVITGSARLDYFRSSGDSLVGRYFLSKMNPLHPNDLTHFALNRDEAWNPKESHLTFDVADKSFRDATTYLYELTGFPEPVIVGTKNFYERWKNNHISLITGEDVRDLSRIENIQKLQTLVFLLPDRVGSPLSLNNLRNLLGTAHASIQNWIEVLKKVYLIFEVSPYTKQLTRSVRKERKCYFWDWGINKDQGKRFENFVAVQLQRAVSAWNEWGVGDYSLQYLRTKDGREVDFVITEREKACLLVECKRGEKSLSPNLKYFRERIHTPVALQVIEEAGYLKQAEMGTYIVGLDRFMKLLP